MSRFEGWLRFATAAENDPGAGDRACRSGCPACPRKGAQKLVHCALVALNGDTATRFSALPAADSPQMGMRLPPESEKAFRPASGPSAAPSRPLPDKSGEHANLSAATGGIASKIVGDALFLPVAIARGLRSLGAAQFFGQRCRAFSRLAALGRFGQRTLRRSAQRPFRLL